MVLRVAEGYTHKEEEVPQPLIPNVNPLPIKKKIKLHLPSTVCYLSGRSAQSTCLDLDRFCIQYLRREVIVCLVDIGGIVNRNCFRFIVFNVTFNNISVISWRSVLLVEDTGVPGENHHPVASH